MNWGQGSGEDVTGETDREKSCGGGEVAFKSFPAPNFPNNNLEQNPNRCNR